jgi:hypothetical protein
MEVNPKKTKVMIFQRPSNKQPIPNFYLENKTLQVTHEYNYLGLKLTPNGKFTLAAKQLAEKAHRAILINATRRKLDINKLSPKLGIKIFDSIISPILLYNSEIWGAFINHDFRKWDQSPTEKNHLKFCKTYLGVNRKATNIASRGELGKFPLLLPILKRLMKYIIHINSLPDVSLAKQAFLISKDLYLNNKPSFYSNAIHILKTYTVQTNDLNELELLSNSHIQSYLDIAKSKYTTFWQHNLNNSSKLSFYSTFKNEYKLEDYLIAIKKQLKRTTLSKFRISCHKLRIECGRYQNITREKRICEFCESGEIEDEYHFVLSCKNNAQIRNIFIEKIQRNFALNLECHDVLFFMSSSDSILQIEFSKFIHSCFIRRN